MTGGEVRTVLRQMAVLAALTVAVAGVFHLPLIKRFARGEFRDAFFLPEDFPGVRMIGLAEAEDLFATAAASFVDARQPFFFLEGHVPGALNVPYDSAESPLPGELLALPSDRTLVVYCEEGDCRSSLELAKALDGRGFQDLRVLSGGWEEWERAGLPVERGR